MGIRSVEASKVVTKIATAARRDGLVDRAASVLDSETTEPPTLDDWLSHGERAVLDAVRGRLPEAHARIESLKALGLSLQRDLVRAEALVTLWSGEAGQARVRLLAMLEDHCARGDLLALHEPLALAAWAVADSPDEVDDYRLRELERGWGEAVFGANAVGASRRAAGATYAAERARAAGGATSHQWHAAATEWDQLGRPHDAAYCRWRTAQVAITDGQRTVAERLLRRAAREARGHVPLTDAIAATAGYSQRCESRS